MGMSQWARTDGTPCGQSVDREMDDFFEVFSEEVSSVR